MYTLVRARYRLDRRAGRWIEANLANELVTTLSAKYGDVYLYIEYPGTGGAVQKALHWDNVINWLNEVDTTVTVQQWLTSLGNRTLPFDATLPNEDVRLVKYAQAWHCGYNVQPVATNGHVDQQISKFEKQDLLLTHPKHAPQKIRDYSMVTVNGMFHLTDWTDAGVRVIDGNTTLRRSNDNQIGIYSFETIGKLTYIPVTDEMITSQGETAPLWDGAYLTMPAGVDLTNKTVLLVTGGYLNVLSNVYTRVAERTWRISFGKMMFLDRYIESARCMDLSSLGLTINANDPTEFVVNELKNDAVIRAYLTLSQTFFVIVDSPTFFHGYEPVEYLNLPGRFIDETYNRLPMVGAYGRMLDYHTIHEPHETYLVPDKEPMYVYCATRNVRHDYDAEHMNWTQQGIINGGRYPAHPFRDETAFFRVMGVEG
ncbi:virion structural protein [Pseudomonas phage PhiPA3]|uniref:Virion structural protein n=1 Tax=Pseudomonas phage PhiPA3 TaxID=998086 RepID=F8SK22_BPPA3|nr:virion structural protein [Pseudomonas phage PhiPA3]AEH03572.1 virion structural protein [Pseudomonas phage PhiPA3]